MKLPPKVAAKQKANHNFQIQKYKCINFYASLSICFYINFLYRQGPFACETSGNQFREMKSIGQSDDLSLSLLKS